MIEICILATLAPSHVFHDVCIDRFLNIQISLTSFDLIAKYKIYPNVYQDPSHKVVAILITASKLLFIGCSLNPQ